MIDFIQIGFNKTATTFLERNVYKKHPQIECVQIAGIEKIERLFFNKFIYPESFSFDKNNFEREFSGICREYFKSDGKTAGLMFESFTFNYATRLDRGIVIRRLKECFPGVKIILFIRSQSAWIPSHYSQYVQNGGRLNFHDFIECMITGSFPDGSLIDWYPLVDDLYQNFPEEDIFIGLYEDLMASPQTVANGLYRFLNVPAIAIDEHTVNQSLNIPGLYIKRFSNYCIPYDCGASPYSFFRDLNDAQPGWFRRAVHQIVYRFYKPKTIMIAKSIGRLLPVKRKLKIGPAQQEKIVKKYHENNKKLSELLNIDLDRYGYP